MSLSQATKTAKAIGIITWSADKVFRFGKNMTSSVYNTITKRTRYDIDVHSKNGEIFESYKGVSRYKVNSLLDSMEDFHNLGISIKSHKARIEDETF